MSTSKLFVVRLLACATFVLCCALATQAQFRANVQGTVSDQSGGVVGGATVTLTNNETNQTRTMQSSENGFYRFSQLPPGNYTISAEQPGFQRTVLDNVTVRAEETQGFDIQLTTGQVSETVTVSSDTSQSIQTETANVDNVITQREVENLPQFGRDPYELARLTPGVFGQGARSGSGGAVNLPNTTGPGGSSNSIFQTENQVQISANGQRLSSNNFQIDGVSANSLNWGGAAVVTPNQESVKEVRVLSSSYSAEDGRNSGAQIKVVSKSGTNRFSGSAFFKYNDPKLNSFNTYGGPGNAVGVFNPPVRVEDRFRQFGGSIGGPIYLPRFGEGGPAYLSGKNRLFFFFSTEGARNRTNNLSNVWVETPQFRQLVAAQRAGGVTAQILQKPGTEPRIVSTLPADCTIFAANVRDQRCRVVAGGLDLGSLAGGLRQYVASPIGGGFDGIPDIQNVQVVVPNQSNGQQYNTRFDYNRGANVFSLSTYLTGRDDLAARSVGGARPNSDIRSQPLNSSGTFAFIRTLSATIVNEARINATRFASDQVAASRETDFGIPQVRVERIPNINQITFGAGRAGTTPGLFAQNTFEFRDTLTVVRSNHALKFGAELRWEQNNSNVIGAARPDYSFDGLWNLANDAPLFQAISANPTTGAPATGQRYFRTNVYGFFAQDDWKASPNLTINYGLRYEYFTPLREKRGQISKLVLGETRPLLDARIVLDDELSIPDRNNFAPRIGFAYSPNTSRFGGLLGQNRAVIRGGFGIFYNRIPTALYSPTRSNPPFIANYGLCCGDITNPFFNGQIQYSLGANRSVTSYPVNSALVRGVDPTTNLPIAGAVEIYGSPAEQPNPYVYVYSLDTQYNLPFDLVGSLGYQGSAGRKLIRLVNQNFLYENNPRLNAVFFVTPDVNSNYNGMNARLSRRFSRGFQADAIYRWSKSIDQLSYEGPGFVTNQTFPQDQSTERGPSDFDVRHHFVLSSLYDIPLFKNQRGFFGKVLGGFQLSTILTRHSGFPWTPVTNLPALITPGGRRLSPVRPIAYFGGALTDTSDEAFIRQGGNFPGGSRQYFEITGDVVLPGIGRNSFRGPQYFNVDLSVIKSTRLGFLGETGRLDLRANFFNPFNLLNLQNIQFGSGSSTIENELRFGRSPGGLAGRVVELQARFSF